MLKKEWGNHGINNELFEIRLPVLIWLSFVYAGSVSLQFLRDPIVMNSSLFTGLFTIHVLLHRVSYRIVPRYFWIYFSIQNILIYLCAILMPYGYHAVLIGLLPILIAQSLSFSLRIKRAVIVSIVSCFVFFDAVQTIGDTEELLKFLPVFILMLIIVVAYAILFFRQVQERYRVQSYLLDLEAAHQKVEELTLSNERQRMARDLHDTLAQGVAGLIMQLEAVDAYMSKGNTERAQDIIKNSMQQARKTLAEARRAIDNLRLKSAPDLDFKEAIDDEIEHFREATGIQIMTTIQLNQRLSRVIMEHTLYIVREGLTNIARHAQADKVIVIITDAMDQLNIELVDNGKGFDTDAIGKDAGHYGLLGIRERARLIGGELTIKSGTEGTVLNMRIPYNGG